MRPLPPAPNLPDLAEVLHKATIEGVRQGIAWAKKDKEQEESRLKIKRERDQSPESLFVTQDKNTKTNTHVAVTTLSSGPFAGLRSAKKRVREHASLEQESKDSFGPAKKVVKKAAVRENVDSDEESKASFGPAKKVVKKAAVRENVDSEEESKTSFGPAKKVVKQGGVLKNVQTINSRTTDQGTEWYDSVDPKQTYSRGDMQNLKYLYTLVNNAKKDAADGKDMTQSLGRIRQRLQQMEFYTSLSPILVKKSGLLDDGGLHLIFENRVQGVYFPHEIRADADILFRKWMGGQVDPHLFRGIVTKTGTAKEERGFKSHSIDPNFAGKISSNYVGAGNLVNGQWWPLQLCAKRDGAHGEREAGIHGQKGKGAYSVVVSGGGYANVDNGDSIKYCGTQGTEDSPSAGTNLMLKAHENQQSLRVLRSASLPASNPYRPARGIRYDGLYRIISYEVLDQQTAMYRFSLSRIGGQDPIRNSGEGIVPSNAQTLELNKIREQID